MRKAWKFMWFSNKKDAVRFALAEGKLPPFRNKHPRTGKSGWAVNI